MSIPKEPRQLMINLMYLVLTALLALNVSNEILRAFDIVDDSIVKSNDNIAEKNANTVASIEAQLENPRLKPDKRRKLEYAFEQAKQVQEDTKKITDQLNDYKDDVAERAGGYQADGRIKKASDLEAASGYMLTDGNGDRMRSGLKQFKGQMAGYINNLPEDMMVMGYGEDFAKTLPINVDDTKKSSENPDGSWSFENFNMVPAVAANTIIDKYISDVKNSESATLEMLYAAAMSDDIKDENNKAKKKIKKVKPIIKYPPPVKKQIFRKYNLLAAAENSYVLPGEKVKVRAMLGAYNAGERNLRISVNGKPQRMKNGLVEYTTGAVSGSGEKSITISGQYFDTNYKKWIQVPSEKITYYVGAPNATISLDKMNVFYYGVDNPITVSASGIPSDRIKIKTSSNLKVFKRDGTNRYWVSPTKFGGKAQVSIVGTLSDGSTKTFGPFEYRLKRVPDPVPVIAGKRVKFEIPANALKAQQAIFAKLDNFPFDLNFDVVSFEAFYVPRRGEARPGNARNKYLNDPRANTTIKSIIQDLSVGDRVIFENIRAVMRKDPNARSHDPRKRNIGNISVYCPN